MEAPHHTIDIFEATPPTMVNGDDGPKSWGTYIDEQAAWLDAQRGVVMVVATMVAGMAFGGGLNPPGGVFSRRFSSGNTEYPEGVSVLAVNNPPAFRRYYMTNQIAFLASISVVLMLLTGLPFNGRVRVCMLTATVAAAVVAIMLNSGYAVAAFTPFGYHELDPMLNLMWYSTVVWGALVAIIVIFHARRLLINLGRMSARIVV